MQVSDSLNGMKRAEPAVEFYNHVILKINKPEPKIIRLPLKQWVAAAILLLAINIGSVIYYSTKNKHYTLDTQSINPFAAEIQSENSYNY